MKKALLLILSFFAFVVAQTNYTRDTCQISAFKADSLKYSKTFNFGVYENAVFEIEFNDTSTSGFQSDSGRFVWGLQTGRPSRNFNGTIDTSWNVELVMDSVRMDTAANYVYNRPTLGTDGTISSVLKFIDTVSVSGLAKQERYPILPWDVYVRFWFKGLTGNKIGRFLWLRARITQRSYVQTRSN